jgi:hypothetical protein
MPHTLTRITLNRRLYNASWNHLTWRDTRCSSITHRGCKEEWGKRGRDFPVEVVPAEAFRVQHSVLSF